MPDESVERQLVWLCSTNRGPKQLALADEVRLGTVDCKVGLEGDRIKRWLDEIAFHSLSCHN